MKKYRKLSYAYDFEEDPEFQMAPMIDVVFQLLIFFMCVTTLQSIRVLDVDLPIAKDSVKSPEEKTPQIVVNLKWQGAEQSPIYNINGVNMKREEIEPFLKDFQQRNKEARVLLRADYLVHYRHVKDIMTASSRAGIGRIVVVTLQANSRMPGGS